MANESSPGSAAASHNAPGFSLTELLVSISIITLLGTIVIMDLSSGRRKEELLNGAKIVAADLRALQARALAGQNVKTCDKAPGKITCELAAAGCDVPASCAPLPPYSFGMHLATASSTYSFFADVSSPNDWMDTPVGGEAFFSRNLATSGAPNVQVWTLSSGVLTPSDAHVAFERQNGAMHISPCALAPCASATTLTITVRHSQSLETRTVSLNAITGRVSVN